VGSFAGFISLSGVKKRFEKLENYVLKSKHPDGRHKARVFQSALEIERRHANVLAELIHKTRRAFQVRPRCTTAALAVTD
jgi:hypothetical protein